MSFGRLVDWNNGHRVTMQKPNMCSRHTINFCERNIICYHTYKAANDLKCKFNTVNHGGSRMGHLGQMTFPPSLCGGVILLLIKMLNLVRPKSIYVTHDIVHITTAHCMQTQLKPKSKQLSPKTFVCTKRL